MGQMVKNLFEILMTLLFMVGIFIFIRKIKALPVKLLLSLSLVVTLFLFLPHLIHDISWMKKLRFLPMVIFFSIIYFGHRVFREKEEIPSEQCFSFFILSVFSFLLLGKIILKTQILHYGFGLAMPATMMVVSFLLFHLPLCLKNKYQKILPFRVMSIALLGIFILAHIDISRYAYSLKNQAIISAKGTIITWNPRVFSQGKIIETAIQEINKLMKPQDRFMVFPEGVMLNYLTERKNPSSYINFMPTELIVFKEEKILADIQKTPPDYILIAEKITDEYGYHYFGKDYGQKIYSWLMRNYFPITTIGAPPLTGEGFGIQILKHRGTERNDDQRSERS
jgi:hypothetical protein